MDGSAGDNLGRAAWHEWAESRVADHAADDQQQIVDLTVVLRDLPAAPGVGGFRQVLIARQIEALRCALAAEPRAATGTPADTGGQIAAILHRFRAGVFEDVRADLVAYLDGRISVTFDGRVALKPNTE